VRLLQAVQPDLVIGDFRLSLSVSARLQRTPYITVSNAYWSPWVRQHYTVPNLPLTGVLPIWLADPLFRLIRPLAFASHAVPLNRVRRRHGLPSLGSDLLLNSLAAIVVGGTSLAGGSGGPQRTLIGVLIIALMDNGLNLLGVSEFMQMVIKGAVVIAAVLTGRQSVQNVVK